MILFSNRSYYATKNIEEPLPLEEGPVENQTVGICLENPNVNSARVAEGYDACKSHQFPGSDNGLTELYEYFWWGS